MKRLFRGWAASEVWQGVGSAFMTPAWHGRTRILVGRERAFRAPPRADSPVPRADKGFALARLGPFLLTHPDPSAGLTLQDSAPVEQKIREETMVVRAREELIVRSPLTTITDRINPSSSYYVRPNAFAVRKDNHVFCAVLRPLSDHVTVATTTLLAPDTWPPARVDEVAAFYRAANEEQMAACEAAATPVVRVYDDDLDVASA